jgi:hypothetical protein
LIETFKGIKKTDSLLKTAIENSNKSAEDAKAKSDSKSSAGDKAKASQLASLKFETTKQGELYLSALDQIEKAKVILI